MKFESIGRFAIAVCVIGVLIAWINSNDKKREDELDRRIKVTFDALRAKGLTSRQADDAINNMIDEGVFGEDEDPDRSYGPVVPWTD